MHGTARVHRQESSDHWLASHRMTHLPIIDPNDNKADRGAIAETLNSGLDALILLDYFPL